MILNRELVFDAITKHRSIGTLYDSVVAEFVNDYVVADYVTTASIPETQVRIRARGEGPAGITRHRNTSEQQSCTNTTSEQNDFCLKAEPAARRQESQSKL